MRNPLVLPKIRKLAGHGAGLQISPQRGSEMSGKLQGTPQNPSHICKTLVLPSYKGLNPDVFFVVNFRRSDSAASGKWTMPAITFLSIIDHECLQCLLGRLDFGHLFLPALMLTAGDIKDIYSFSKFIIGLSISTKPSDLSGTVFFLQFIPPVSTPCSVHLSHHWFQSNCGWLLGCQWLFTKISQHIKNMPYTLITY